MDYCEVQKLFDTQMPFGALRHYWKSHFLPELLDALIDEALANAADAPSDVTLSSLWNMGAATTAVPAEATALGDRPCARPGGKHFSSLRTQPRRPPVRR